MGFFFKGRICDYVIHGINKRQNFPTIPQPKLAITDDFFAVGHAAPIGVIVTLTHPPLTDSSATSRDTANRLIDIRLRLDRRQLRGRVDHLVIDNAVS